MSTDGAECRTTVKHDAAGTGLADAVTAWHEGGILGVVEANGAEGRLLELTFYLVEIFDVVLCGLQLSLKSLIIKGSNFRSFFSVGDDPERLARGPVV